MTFLPTQTRNLYFVIDGKMGNTAIHKKIDIKRMSIMITSFILLGVGFGYFKDTGGEKAKELAMLTTGLNMLTGQTQEIVLPTPVIKARSKTKITAVVPAPAQVTEPTTVSTQELIAEPESVLEPTPEQVIIYVPTPVYISTPQQAPAQVPAPIQESTPTTTSEPTTTEYTSNNNDSYNNSHNNSDEGDDDSDGGDDD